MATALGKMLDDATGRFWWVLVVSDFANAGAAHILRVMRGRGAGRSFVDFSFSGTLAECREFQVKNGGDADGLEFLRRMSEPGSAHTRQRVAAVGDLHDDRSCTGRQRELILYDDYRSACFGDIRRELMTVRHRTFDAGEQTSRFCFSRVEDDIAHLCIQP